MQRGTIILYIILNRCGERDFESNPFVPCSMTNILQRVCSIISSARLLSYLAKRLSCGWQQNQVGSHIEYSLV